jgi:hypothetical protein
MERIQMTRPRRACEPGLLPSARFTAGCPIAKLEAAATSLIVRRLSFASIVVER